MVRPVLLSVAVAANMMPAMREIQAAYKARAGAELVLTQGSSGKFAAQIRNGAPFDVFVSADMSFPEALAQDGFSQGPARRYANGSLVLWSLTGADVSSLAALTRPQIKRIAVADPERAPYGRAAVEALKNAGVYAAVEKKLVYGESAAQVNQFVASRAVEAGLAARSIVASGEWHGRGAWTPVDPALHAPIEQGFIVTRLGARRHGEQARRFAEMLLGPEGRRILRRHGYSVP